MVDKTALEEGLNGFPLHARIGTKGRTSAMTREFGGPKFSRIMTRNLVACRSVYSPLLRNVRRMHKERHTDLTYRLSGDRHERHNEHTPTYVGNPNAANWVVAMGHYLRK